MRVWAGKVYFALSQNISCCRLFICRVLACARAVSTMVVVLVLFLLMFFTIIVATAAAAAATAAVASVVVGFFSHSRTRRHSFIFVGELIATKMKNIKWLDLWRREVKIGNRV